MAVIGNNRKFVSALIVPSFIAIEDWCEDKDIDVTDRVALLKNPQIVELIQGEVSSYNVNFAKVEQVKKFTLVPTEWSPESGELTPTMKPKRRVINERYQDLIEAMYAS
jgi:long-chain acyl-CoA synthetase